MFLPSNTKIGRRRPPRWIYPRLLERKYTKQVSSSFGATLMAAIRAFVIPALPRLVSIHERTRPERSDSLRTDGWPEEVKLMRQKMTLALGKVQRDIERSAMSISIDLYGQNRNQWRKIQTAMLGVEAIGENETWAGDTLRSWIDGNVNLISKLSEEAVTNVEGVVTRGLQGGARVEDMASDIVGDFGVGPKAERKARFIARDQIAKLNGQITRARQTELGVRRYIWRTSEDERVRPSHAVLEGLTCTWSDSTIIIRYDEDGAADRIKRSSLVPPGFEGSPGEDYQCRCYAEPVLDDIVQLPAEEEPIVVPVKRAPRSRQPAAVSRKPLRSLSPAEQDAQIDRKITADIPRLEKWQTEVAAAKEAYERAAFKARSEAFRGRMLPRVSETPEQMLGRRQQIASEVKAAQKQAEKARKEYEKLADQKIQSYLESRWGAKRPSVPEFADYTRPTSSAHKKRSKAALKWTKDVANLFEIEALQKTGRGKVRVALERLPAGHRGRAYQESGGVYLPTNTTRRQVAHEVGHTIEFWNDNVREAAKDFLERRTKGEEKQPLALVSGRGYSWHEITKKDKFPDPYCGKIYPERIQGGRGATEIVSMGIEYFMTDPLKFFRADPDYFRFIVKLISGVY